VAALLVFTSSLYDKMCEDLCLFETDKVLQEFICVYMNPFSFMSIDAHTVALKAVMGK